MMVINKFNNTLVNYRTVCADFLFSAPSVTSPCIYRGGIVSNLSNDITWQLKNEYYIECNIDLRSKAEILTHKIPDAVLNKDMQYVHIPLHDDINIFRKIRLPNCHDYFEYYLSLLESNSSSILDLLNFFADSKYKRFFINCYLGKDRTQIITMLLLEILEIDQSIIIADYVQSEKYLMQNVNIFKKNWLNKKLTKEEYLPRLQPQSETLKLLYDFVNKKYGGFNSLLKSWGLEKIQADKIKRKFLAKH